MQVSERAYEARHTLGRLFRMGLPELVCRSRRETFKWVDRIRRGGAADRALRPVGESLSGFVRNCEEHFFQGPFDERVPDALTSREREELLAIADRASRGRFDLLGYHDLDFGAPVDWHFDPVSGIRAPMAHWTKLDPLDRATVGDSKVVWELNRHQWLVHLGQAWRLTRDERYAETLIRYGQQWLRSNPPGIGINWASSLEVGFRLVAWCWAFVLIRDSRALSQDVFSQFEEAVTAHATHVERYLSYYFSPNTHLTGEALGLFYAGVVFQRSKSAARWRSLATRILVQEIERQALPDGVYFERSTCYQRYTIDIYLHFLILAGRAGVEVPPIVTERMKSMLDALIALRHPDGSMPSIGDADGGMVLPLGTTRPDDYRATFSTAAVMFNDPVYAWAAGRIAPETLWLLGTPAVTTFESLEKTRPSSDKCRVFPAGGFAVMRSGWDEAAHALIFDAGPLGCQFSSGHGHADLLSIQCSAFGRPYLVDAGTGSYADPELRGFFRGTASHSTVMIDGKSQAEPAGPFSWRSRCAAQLLRWESNQSFALADAKHDGYGALPDPVSHRRRVAFIKSRYWIVIDDLIASATHRVDVRFQFAPMQVRIDDTGWVRATSGDRRGLLLRAFTSTPFQATVREGHRNPMEGWVSSNYGHFEPAPAVVFTATTQLPVRVVTLLWPAEDVDQTPRVNVTCDALNRPSALTIRDRRETTLFDDAELLIVHHP
ncbi:MAG: heparinase II/III domain-containing protein [Thermoanaerobaculia bacterium]